MLGEDPLELLAQTALFMGVLAVGVALGASLGLTELQTSCIAAGKLPAPGTSLLGQSLDENACWEGARRMQTIANGSGVLGGVLLLGGALLDHYDERVREVLGR